MKPWERLIYKLIIFVFRSMGLLSRKQCFSLGAFFGNLWFSIDKRHRKLVLQNITLALGNDMSEYQCKQLCRRIFQNIATMCFEIGWSLSKTPEELSGYFTIRGMENLKRAIDMGKGVLQLTGHIGNWEVALTVLSQGDYPINIVYRPLDFKPLDQFILYLRTRFGVKMYPLHQANTYIKDALSKNEVVIVLLDRNTGCSRGTFVDFFNRPACAHKGLASLALKTGAPVMPLLTVRDINGYIIEYGEIIPMIQTGDHTKDIEANTQKYTEVLESIIRRYPDQWFWVHNRWKTKPYSIWPRNEKKC
ncbi:MAG: lysophospholipid acyltransferase family protein [Desulfobacterales bacterium]|nr:lysophospholipid acyltransferase family protein [Desulfobacterales bacterium]